MSAPVGYRKPSDLPEVIPVFPLDGAVLLPRSVLPLNIFEPRYLNMIDDAMSGSRLIGMVQTTGRQTPAGPALQGVGCVGRITSYAETPDSRYLITLTGVCRFGIRAELEARTPYRQVKADFERFAHDLARAPMTSGFDREGFLSALRGYLVANDLDADWSSIESAPPETLINALSVICPFEPGEKQALLEAASVEERRETLLALLRFGAASGDGAGSVQ